MKFRYLGIGLIAAIIVTILAFALKNWSLLFKVSGVIAAIALGGSAIFSGILGSGDRIRANYSHEEDNDRKIRQNLAINLFLFSLPNIAVALVYLIMFS